jgi:hypothetical protein
MKTAYYVIGALALAVAGAAFGADEPANAAAAAGTTSTAATAVTAATAPAAPQARGLTREEVRAQVIEARRNGTLIETEADMDVARTRQQIAR